MVEPSRSDTVNHLSNVFRTAPSFVGRREGLSRSKNILQERQLGTLRHPLQVGYVRGYGVLLSVSLPFVQDFQATRNQPFLERERTLGTNVRDRAELQYEAGIAHRRNQEVWPCLTHHEEAIKVCLLAGNIWGLAKVLVRKIEANLILASVRFNTLVYPKPLYFSDTAFSPVLPCAHS
jgi:hypothetical protein